MFKFFRKKDSSVILKTREGREIPSATLHRFKGYKLLSGHGLEIGALHEPAQIPEQCTIEYCDAQSKEETLKNFPELENHLLVEVNHICDVDKQGLAPFPDERYDFVIFNHVIEHIANPINIIGELFRVTKSGSLVVISAPDKRYTFDKNRPLTTFEHLLTEYNAKVTQVTDEHYMEFISLVHPDLLSLSEEVLQAHLDSVKRRREHAHVWDSDSFKAFLTKSFKLLKLNPRCVFEHTAKRNGFEYFSVWRKRL